MNVFTRALADQRGEGNAGKFALTILAVAIFFLIKLFPVYYGQWEIEGLVETVINRPVHLIKAKKAGEIKKEVILSMKLNGYDPAEMADIKVRKSRNRVEVTVETWFWVNFYVGEEKEFYKKIRLSRKLR